MQLLNQLFALPDWTLWTAAGVVALTLLVLMLSHRFIVARRMLWGFMLLLAATAAAVVAFVPAATEQNPPTTLYFGIAMVVLLLVEPVTVLVDRFVPPRTVRQSAQTQPVDEIGYLDVHASLDESIAQLEFRVDLPVDEEAAEIGYQPVKRFYDIADVAAEYPRFVLVGAAGSGKTTALRQLMTHKAQAYRENRRENPMPFWIDLGASDNPGSGSELLNHWWTTRHRLHNAKDINSALAHNQLILLFDGLDQMPDGKHLSRASRARSLRDWIADHPELPLVVTCRERDYAEIEVLNIGLPVVTLHELDSKRTAAIIEKRTSRSEIQSQIEGSEALKALANNPLNLIMLICLYDANQTLPTTLHECFSAYIRARYEAAQVRLSFERFEHKLRTLAYQMIMNEQVSAVPVLWAQRRIDIGRTALQDGFDTGLLVCEQNMIRFEHPSIQGYFALPELTDQLRRSRGGRERDVQLLRSIADLHEVGDMAVPALFETFPETDTGEIDLRPVYVDALESIRTDGAISAMGHLLDKENVPPDLRLHIVEFLAEQGTDAAILGLIRALKDHQVELHDPAGDGLVRIGGDTVVDALTELKQDSNHVYKDTTRQLLGEIGTERSIQSLIQDLYDPAPDVRRQVVQSLGQLGARQALEPIIDRLKEDSDPTVRAMAAMALGAIGTDRAVKALTNELDGNNPQVVLSAAGALGRLQVNDKEVIARLGKVIEKHNEDVKTVAAGSLMAIGTPAATETLIKVLKSENNEAIAVAAQSLATTRVEAAIPALVELIIQQNKAVEEVVRRSLETIGVDGRWITRIDALTSQNRAFVRRATMALGSVGSEEVIRALIRAVEDRDYFIRSSAMKALEQVEEGPVIQALMVAARDGDAPLKRSAIKALGDIASESAIPALIDSLKDADSDIRRISAQALGDIGSEDAIPALSALLNDPEWSVRLEAVTALGKTRDEEVIPPLDKALRDSELSVQSAAVKALEELATLDAILALINALQRRSIRTAAAEALKNIGMQLVMPPVKEALESDDEDLSEAALWLLGQFSPPVAIPALIEALDEEHRADIRRSAAISLGQMNAIDAIPALIRALQDESIRDAAASALLEIGGNRVMSQLRASLTSQDKAVRDAAVWGMKQFHPEDATPAFIHALQYNYPTDVRTAAAEALGEMHARSAARVLMEALGGSVGPVKMAAARALGQIRVPTTLDALIGALDDEYPVVRATVAEALGEMGNKTAIPNLITALDDYNPAVQSAAAISLGQLQAQDAVPKLIQMLHHGNEDVRDAVVGGLRRIGTNEALNAMMEYRRLYG